MEGDRAAVVALHQRGMVPSAIHKSTNIPLRTVYNIIKRFRETGGTRDRPRSGRPRSVRTRKLKEAIRQRIKRKPGSSARKIAKTMGVNRESVRKVLKDDLQLLPFKLQAGHHLNDKAKATRLQRAKWLQQRFSAENKHRAILFSDEKLFTVERQFNKQNDRIWSPSASTIDPAQRIISRSQHPASIMVWAGICATGKTPLVFVTPGAKVNAAHYQKEVLEKVVLPWSQRHFNGAAWTFQQDSAPAHRAKCVQQWCRTHFPDFISSTEWPPYSPDLNPLDFSVWSILETKACGKVHSSIESLKVSLEKAWEEIGEEELRGIVDAFPKRLKACVKAKGDYFEN